MQNNAIQIRTVNPSPHLEPFFAALNKRAKSFSLVCRTLYPGKMRERIGWSESSAYPVAIRGFSKKDTAQGLDVVIEMLKDLHLMESRVARNEVTFYMAERWFKPPIGFLRMLSPRYIGEACRFCRLFRYNSFMALPIGIHAVRDFARLNGLLLGDLRCMWTAPKLVFERKVGGRIWPLSVLRNRLSSREVAFAKKNGFVGIDPQRVRDVALSKRYNLDRMRVWSYFAEDSNKDSLPHRHSKGEGVNVLWVGRMLDWKRVDVLIKAFKKVLSVMPTSQLNIVGEGPEREKLEKLAGKYKNHEITFSNYLKTGDVRKLMQTADIYVMPSDGGEGWGAAVLEALMEKCCVISTVEAGSSATMLPIANLYNFQKVEELANKICNLQSLQQKIEIDDWTGECAAESLLDLVATMKACQHESERQDK